MIIFSCASMTETDVKVYFMDQGKLQYYFPSQHWISKDHKESLDVDFLYRSYKLEDDAESRTVINFTLYSDDIQLLHRTPVSSLSLADGDEPIIHSTNISTLYAKQEEVRYTCWVTSKDFSDYILSCDNPEIRLETENGSFLFYPKTHVFKEHIEYFRAVSPSYE